MGDLEDYFYVGDGQFNLIEIDFTPNTHINKNMFTRLLIEKNIISMGNIEQCYTKHFGNINFDLNTHRGKYLFARNLSDRLSSKFIDR